MNTLENKIAGAIYGFAIGDAMGATTEFMSEAQIKMYYGVVDNIIGGGWLDLNPGDVTDDTQMTMCVMDALMKNHEQFEENCMNNFIEWFKSGPKDIGGQCYRGIQHYIQTNEKISIDRSALGNGSLMRAMPCALLNELDLNILQGSLTHNNRTCSQIIQDYSRLIYNILYNNLYTCNIKDILEPYGYIWNTFNNSCYWANKSTFEEAIIGAVNHGGDADTIAAITGSIAGARFGYDNIPKRWIEQLNPDIKIFLEKFKNFAFTYVQR